MHTGRQHNTVYLPLWGSDSESSVATALTFSFGLSSCASNCIRGLLDKTVVDKVSWKTQMPPLSRGRPTFTIGRRFQTSGADTPFGLDRWEIYIWWFFSWCGVCVEARQRSRKDWTWAKVLCCTSAGFMMNLCSDLTSMVSTATLKYKLKKQGPEESSCSLFLLC